MHVLLYTFRYGDGYTVTLRVGGETPNLDAVSEFIKSLFPGAVLKVNIFDLSHFINWIRYLFLPTYLTTYLPTYLPWYLPACLTALFSQHQICFINSVVFSINFRTNIITSWNINSHRKALFYLKSLVIWKPTARFSTLKITLFHRQHLIRCVEHCALV